MTASQSSPGLGQSPSVGGGAGGGKGRSGKVQSVTSITSAQLLTASEEGENIFSLDSKELGMVAMVGEVMEISESSTSVVYKLDDRTGPWVKVQKWMDDQDPSDQSERAATREGMYVRIVGHIRAFNKQRSVTAFHVRPLDDFNVLSHHLAEVLYAHLAATRGAPLPEQFKQNQTTQQQIGGATPGGWGAPMATSTQQGGGAVYAGAQADTGLPPAQQQVLTAITQCPMDQGINIHDLIKTMTQHGVAAERVRGAVEFLCNEGHIYSTIDDEHFKSTEA